MLAKESDNHQESSVSISNCQNVNTNVSVSEGAKCDNCDNVSTQVGTSSAVREAGHTPEEKTEEKWAVPEGYRFLSEEFFQVKDIPPPLVSLSWLKLLSSDEDSGEDSIPLAKLKKVIRKKKKGKKSISCVDDSSEVKEKVMKKGKREESENHVNRKRGRPKKESVGVEALENQMRDTVDDQFWGNESDSNVDAEDGMESQEDARVEDDVSFSGNHNEHDYFKQSENCEGAKVKDGNEKKKKEKGGALGVKTAGSKVSFPCYECGKSFSAASTLKCHQRIHNGTLLICPECHRGFVSKYLLKCHMRIHNGDLFMCHKCGRGFTTAELLKVHSRAHTGDRPFACNVCGKSFPTSSNMLQHKQIHNSEKKFLCSQCGSSFVQKRCLDYHMLTHSEKKNICNVCGKLWARKSDLIEHMRVHTGVKPYCCSLCPQKFSQASSLKRHQLVHLDVKPISCGACNKMFKCHEYYKRHLRKHEKEDYSFTSI